MAGIVATAEISIAAPRTAVWAALTDPAKIKKYMFGADVETDWSPGSPIRWRGEWDGKPYEDKGEVLAATEPTRLTVTHYSPLSGAEDRPENYHTIDYELIEHGDHTDVRLRQDGNSSDDEAEHSRQNWEMVLQSLKALLEAS